MRLSIHHYYDQLNEQELTFVDLVFERVIQEAAHKYSVPLAGDGRLERAVDALARAVIESRTPASERSDKTEED